MSKFIQTLVAWGPAGVFFLAILDNGGIPMVGGVDAFVVIIAVADHTQAYWAAAAAVLGSLIGSLIPFYIARKGGERYLERYTMSGRGARFRAWFLEYGMLTIFVPAVVPVIPMPLKIFILSAGALEVSPIRFLLVLAAARVPRYIFLAWMGTKLGSDTLPYLKHHLWSFVGLAVGLFVILYLGIRILHGLRWKNGDSQRRFRGD
jgi:membrane protein YqaA with SNARE-associated domain